MVASLDIAGDEVLVICQSLAQVHQVRMIGSSR